MLMKFWVLPRWVTTPIGVTSLPSPRCWGRDLERVEATADFNLLITQLHGMLVLFERDFANGKVRSMGNLR